MSAVERAAEIVAGMTDEELKRVAAEIVAGMTDEELEQAAKAGRSEYWNGYYADPDVRKRKRRKQKEYYACKAVLAGLKGGGEK